MAKEGRWQGVDLVRGLAAYGVVMIHSLGNQPRTESCERFVLLFLGFAVPYFLAVALFLTAGRLLGSGTAGFLRGRVGRLIVPYLVWTAVFVAVRAVLYAASGRTGDLRSMLASPLSLIFLGKASAQLYFIPLLFLGEVMAVVLVQTLGDRLRRPGLVVALALVGVGVGWFDTLRSQAILNDPSRPDAVRAGLTLLSDAVWCVPFLGLAFFFQLPTVRRRAEHLPPAALLLTAAGLIALDALGAFGATDEFLPYTVRELILAFGGLAVALGVSRLVTPRAWVENLAACTFGIYLAHPLVIEFFELALTRTGRLRGVVVTPPVMAAFAAAAFLLTWALVAATLRVPVLARLLYGARPRPGQIVSP